MLRFVNLGDMKDPEDPNWMKIASPTVRPGRGYFQNGFQAAVFGPAGPDGNGMLLLSENIMAPSKRFNPVVVRCTVMPIEIVAACGTR